MTNEEKKQFLIDAHTLYMEKRPYDDNKTLAESKIKDDDFWKIYYSKFKDLLPKTLYKYRKATKRAISNFKNDELWFSCPLNFDDTFDSTINNDIEAEIELFKKNPDKYILKLAKAIIIATCNKTGQKADMSFLDEVYSTFNGNGEIDEDKALCILKEKMPQCANQEFIHTLKNKLTEMNNKPIYDATINELERYMDMNNRIRENLLVLSLAERGDNQAMWGLYASESRGFCIEYEIDYESFLGQKMISNMFPIIYENKPLISYFDILSRGITSNNTIEGISYEDYMNWFLSMYTKDKTYSFQEEWRITFDKTMCGNLQKFPFAKSIILGEKISKRSENKLIQIAKRKNINIYKRVISKTGSNVILIKM